MATAPTPLESNFLVPGGTLLVALAILSLLLTVAAVVIVLLVARRGPR